MDNLRQEVVPRERWVGFGGPLSLTIGSVRACEVVLREILGLGHYLTLWSLCSLLFLPGHEFAREFNLKRAISVLSYMHSRCGTS